MRLHLHEWGDPQAPPVVCVHGIGAHGRRFLRLAEDRLAARFRVLAPDLRGHGRSGHDPPWDLSTHLDDLLETVTAAGVHVAAWIGHSFGGRLLLELCDRAAERVESIALLDPAIQILPHVGRDFAAEAAKDRSFTTAEEAIASRLVGDPLTPREFLEEEAREHLVSTGDGRLRWRYAREAVVTGYSELCTEPPPPSVIRAPALLVHASRFGLVRDEQLDEYAAALGDRIELVPVPGGHVVYWDAYEETASALESFLSRHARVTHASRVRR
jgi:lipase